MRAKFCALVGGAALGGTLAMLAPAWGQSEEPAMIAPWLNSTPEVVVPRDGKTEIVVPPDIGTSCDMCHPHPPPRTR